MITVLTCLALGFKSFMVTATGCVEVDPSADFYFQPVVEIVSSPILAAPLLVVDLPPPHIFTGPENLPPLPPIGDSRTPASVFDSWQALWAASHP